MSLAAGTPNLDAALDAGVVVAATSVEAPPTPVADPVDQDTLTDLEILDQPDPEPAAVEDPDPDAAKPEPSQAEKDAAEAAKTPEQKEEEKKATEKAAAEAAVAEAELSPSDKAVRDLKAKIASDPDKKAMFDKDPAFANQMWRNARLAQEGEQFREIYPTVSIAKQARADAEDFLGIRGNFYSGKTEGYKGLIKTLWDASIQRDAKGEPIMANGKPVMKPHYDDFFHTYRTTELWPAVLNLSKGDPKEAEISEAVQTIREYIGETDGAPVTTKTAGEAADEDTSRLTPQERADLAELHNLRRQQGESGQREREAFRESVVKAVDDAGTGFLLKRAKGMAPALSENLQIRAASDTWKEIQELAKSDVLLSRLRDNTLAVGGEEGKKRWAAECVKYAEARYRPILEKHIRDLGTPVVAGNADTRKKLETQASAKVIKGAGGAVSSQPPEDFATQMAEGDRLSLKLKGRKLNGDEVLNLEELLPEMRRKAAALPAKA